MKFFKKNPVLILLLITTILICLFFGKIIIQPNTYIFSTVGDGVKNYYTAAYYIKYDNGTHFTGMNYPYGEHVVYTDNQPIISFVLNLIQNYLFAISHYTFGIFNILMIFSVLPCVLFLFLIFKHYLLPDFYAIIAAIIIGFLSPQFSRFAGHYGLSYMFYIPMIWYLLIRFIESNKPFLLSILLSFIISFFTFIHMYYLLLGSIFIMVFISVYYVQNIGSKKSRYLHLFWGFMAAIVPIFISRIFFLLTDTVTDRHQFPFGFFYYKASFESVFLPVYSPFIDVWNTFIKVSEARWEGYAYVGFVGLLVLIFSLIKLIKYIKAKDFKKILKPVLPGTLPAALWASFLILFFSMAIPFKWGLGFFVDWIPFLHQFRSLGRFAWIFYYVFTVYSAFYFYLIYRHFLLKGFKNAANTIIILILFSWAMDAYINVKVCRDLIIQNNIADRFLNNNYIHWLKEKGYTPDDFQAILPFPYFQEGSEKFYIVRSDQSVYEACKASYTTGLPIATGYLARTSISQSLKQVQLLSSQNIEKKILIDYKNKKPLLLIVTNDSLDNREVDIVKKAQLICETESLNLYKLPLSALKPEFNKLRSYFNINKDSLFKGKNYLSTSSSNSIIIKNFDNEQAPESLFGKGALYKKRGKLEIFNQTLFTNKDSITFEVSFWIKTVYETSHFPALYFKQYNESGKLIKEKKIMADSFRDVFRDWVRIAHQFTIYKPKTRIELYLNGKEILIDEFLLRPLNIHVFHRIENDGSMVFGMDNFFIPN